MVLPGHLAGGYLITTGLLAFFHPDFSSTQINSLLVIGTLTGELPDVDLIFFRLKRNKNSSDSHRDYKTHIPFFWISVCIAIIFFGLIFNSSFTEYIGLIIIGGTICHLILDSVEYGIRWFAPISNKRFAIKLDIPEEPINAKPGSIKYYFNFIIKTYWKTKTFWLEIIISIIALFIFFRSF